MSQGPFLVWIVAEGSSIAAWEGPVPSSGDTITVILSGPGCIEPRRYKLRVVCRDWLHKVTYPSASVPWVKDSCCHVHCDILTEESLG